MSMIKKGKQKLIKIAEVIHLKLFGHSMSNTMREFLGNLSWSFFGGVIAAGIMFGVQILAARWLGSEQFGRYNAVVSFATSFSLLMMFGCNVGNIKFLTEASGREDRKNIASTSFTLVTVQVIFFGFFVGTLAYLFGEEYGMSKKFLAVGIFFAIVMTYKNLFDSYLRSFQMIKQQGIFKVVEAVLVFILLLLFVSFKGGHGYIMNYSGYVFISILGYLFFGIVTLWAIKNNFGRVSTKYFKKLLQYNKFVILMSLGEIIFSSEKFILGKQMGMDMLGEYSVYYLGSFLILGIFMNIFMNIFWPTLIGNIKQTKEIVRKMYIITARGIFLWVIINMTVTKIIFIFLGSSYIMNLWLAMGFAVASYFWFLFVLEVSILSVEYIKYSIILTLVGHTLIVSGLFIVESVSVYLTLQILVYGVFTLLGNYVIIKRY